MLTHDPTNLRAYAPAVEARKNLFEIAATESVALYGVTAPNALEAPGDFSFGDFIRRPEALELYGAPADSDCSVLLLEFQQAFTGAATRKELAQFVRARHSGKPRGFRYWDRLAASIWKTYQGVLRGKERTGRAHAGEVRRLATAQVRAGREAHRSALRRIPKNETDKRSVAAAKLRKKAQWLVGRANKKSAEARTLAQAEATLRAQAAALEAKALQLEVDTSERTTVH